MPLDVKSAVRKIVLSLSWLSFFAPSVIGGSLLGIYPGYKAFEFAWKDARFCTSCHVHDYVNVGWSKSIHGQTTTCHDCHHQRLRDYIYETYSMIAKQPKFPQDLHHTPYVKKELCAACHVSNAADRSTITGPMSLHDVQQIPKVDKSYLHQVHLSKSTEFKLLNSIQHTDNERILEQLEPGKSFSQEKDVSRQITCADCHGGPGNRNHNFTAVDTSCVRCHNQVHESKVLSEYGCRSCHFQGFMIPFESQQMKKLKEKSLFENQIQENKDSKD